jgi:hypothetical protein
MDDEAAEFWSAFEKETGEKVVARGMGEYLGSSGSDGGFWGLLVLTDKSFRFKHMPSDNWLRSIFKKAGRSSEPKRNLDLTIPLGDIIAVNAPRSGFLARLFAPAFPRVSVAYRVDGEETLFAFTVDPSNALLPALIAAAGAAKSSLTSRPE